MSKIISTKYPREVNWQNHITFKYAGEEQISLVFLQRLAAYVRDVYPGKKMLIIAGWRNYSKQATLYAQNPINAAKPGTSWHQYRCAIDVDASSQYMTKADFLKTWSLQGMLKYGLFLPMNAVDSSLKECWHIQPIETKAIANNYRLDFLDYDDVICNLTIKKPRLLNIVKPTIGSTPKRDDVILCQKLLILDKFMAPLKKDGTTNADGYFGGGSKTSVINFQRAHGLPATGSVDKATWIKLLKSVDHLGQADAAVDLLIQFLYLSGFIPDASRKSYDTFIETAAKWFQGTMFLKVDGDIGPASWETIYRMILN